MVWWRPVRRASPSGLSSGRSARFARPLRALRGKGAKPGVLRSSRPLLGNATEPGVAQQRFYQQECCCNREKVAAEVLNVRIALLPYFCGLQLPDKIVDGFERFLVYRAEVGPL